LFQHAPNILPMPGMSSLAHLRENIAAAAPLTLPQGAIKQFEAVSLIQASPLYPST